MTKGVYLIERFDHERTVVPVPIEILNISKEKPVGIQVHAKSGKHEVQLSARDVVVEDMSSVLMTDHIMDIEKKIEKLRQDQYKIFKMLRAKTIEPQEVRGKDKSEEE